MVLNLSPSTRRLRVVLLALTVGVSAVPLLAQAADTSAPQQLERFATQAAAPGQPTRGQAFFTSRHGGEWSCSSCHGNPPTSSGKHASTGKAIDAMAPAANPAAFTSTAKVDKWFRRNCNDVLKRECSAGEKADVLAYLLSLKP
jgi:cytochrome c553